MNNDTNPETRIRIPYSLARLLAQHSKIADDSSIQTNNTNKYQRTSFDGKQIAYACLNLFMADWTRDHFFSLLLFFSPSAQHSLCICSSWHVLTMYAHFKHSHFFSTFIIITALKGSLSLPESISIAIYLNCTHTHTYTQGEMMRFTFIHFPTNTMCEQHTVCLSQNFHHFHNGNCMCFLSFLFRKKIVRWVFFF